MLTALGTAYAQSIPSPNCGFDRLQPAQCSPCFISERYLPRLIDFSGKQDSNFKGLAKALFSPLDELFGKLCAPCNPDIDCVCLFKLGATLGLSTRRYSSVDCATMWVDDSDLVDACGVGGYKRFCVICLPKCPDSEYTSADCQGYRNLVNGFAKYGNKEQSAANIEGMVTEITGAAAFVAKQDIGKVWVALGQQPTTDIYLRLLEARPYMPLFAGVEIEYVWSA